MLKIATCFGCFCLLDKSCNCGFSTLIMRTDEHLLMIFQEHPEWLFDFTGTPNPGPCRMASENQKKVVNLQLSSDSVFRPIETNRTIFVVEFLLTAFKDDPYINIVQKMTIIQQGEIPLSQPKKKGGRRRRSGKPKRGVEGILIISNQLTDPATSPWNRIIETLVFEDIAAKFCTDHPDHPLTPLLRPIYLANENELERHVGEDYAALREMEKSGSISSQVCDAYLDLVWQRFRERPIEEIKKMITFEEVDLKESVAGKQIWDEAAATERADVLLEQAKKRFGKVKAATVKKIRALSAEDLNQLTLDLLDLESLAELEDWLAKRSAN